MTKRASRSTSRTGRRAPTSSRGAAGPRKPLRRTSRPSATNATRPCGGRGAPVSLNAATSPSLLGWAYQLASLVGWSSVPLLPWLDVPTLILAGDEDQVVPAWNAQFLHALIPDSRLRLIEGGGHLFMLSHPREFVAELERFLGADAAVESA